MQEGIIEGYHDGTIRPDQPITRVEAAVIIARALQLVWEADQESGFADNDAIPQWGRGAVEVIREQGIINGRGDHEFAFSHQRQGRKLLSCCCASWNKHGRLSMVKSCDYAMILLIFV